MIELFGEPPTTSTAPWWPAIQMCLVYAGCLIGSIMATVSGHELGHVILGKLAGYSFERISFGSGRNLLSFRIGGTLVELNLGILDGQVAPNHATHPDSGARQILLSSGGVLANAAMAGAAVAAWLLLDLPAWARVAAVLFALCNAAYIGLSLAPYTAREADGQYNEMDAYQVLRTLRAGPSRADQNDYMALVSPYFTEEFEPAPSRAAREVVQNVKALRMAAWRAGSDAAKHKQVLSDILAHKRLTKAEARLVQDALGPQAGNEQR